MKSNYLKSKHYSVARDIFGIILFLSVLLYLSIGFGLGVWHPTWIIFIVGAVLTVATNIVCRFIYNKEVEKSTLPNFDKHYESTFVYAKSVKVSGYLFIFSIIAYVVISAITGLWHPLWLIFFGMAIVEQIVAVIFKLNYKDYKVKESEKGE